MPLSNKKTEVLVGETESDPVSHAWHKASQRRRYKRHKERGSVKLISMMTSREIRHQRSMSVGKRQQKCRLSGNKSTVRHTWPQQRNL